MGFLLNRGRGTRGRAARAVAGMETVEVKATIPSHQVQAGLERLALSSTDREIRYVYFLDTPHLSLLDAGIVVRARRRIGGQHDSTAKLRPVVPEDVPKRWRRHEGFKLEADASEQNVTRSGSLTLPVGKGLIKAVAAGDAPVHKLLHADQLEFLRTMTVVEVDTDELRLLGPIEAIRWKLRMPALPWPLTAELWRRPDGEEILEVSVKAPAEQAAVAYYGFIGYLAELGAEHDPHQQAKTRWALEFFSRAPGEPAVAGT